MVNPIFAGRWSWLVSIGAILTCGIAPIAQAEVLQNLIDADPPNLVSADGSVSLSNFQYTGPFADTIEISADPSADGIRFIVTGTNGLSKARVLEVVDDEDLLAVLEFTATTLTGDFGLVALSMEGRARGVVSDQGQDISSSILIQEFVRPADGSAALTTGQVFTDADEVGPHEAELLLDPDTYGPAINLETRIGLNTVTNGSATLMSFAFSFVAGGGAGGEPGSGGGGSEGGGGGGGGEGGGGQSVLTAIRVNPSVLTLCFSDATVQLHVTGIFSDGTEADLTSAATGTQYVCDTLEVATVSGHGLVRAGNEGTAIITVINGEFVASVQVAVDYSCGPSAGPCGEGQTLASIALTVEDVTLDAGSTIQLDVVGVDCDGEAVEDLAGLPETTFESADPAVACVTNDGLLTTENEGQTTVTVRYEELAAELAVTVLPVEPAPGGDVPGDGTTDDGLTGDDSSHGDRRAWQCGACGALGMLELLLIVLGLVGLRQSGRFTARRTG